MPKSRAALHLRSIRFGSLTGVEAIQEARMSRSLVRRPIVLEPFGSRAGLSAKERAAASRRRQLERGR